MNNLYAFPPKPRNMWEFGVSGIAPSIHGDVPAVSPTFGYGVHVRKALGYLLSVRAAYAAGTAEGLSWQSAVNYQKNTAWVNTGYVGAPASPAERVFYNYQTKFQDISLQAVLNISNIRFHTAKTKIALYAFGGVGATAYSCNINALNGTSKYNFGSIASGVWDTRNETRNALKNILDKTYETPADNATRTNPTLGDKTVNLNASFGFGLAFRLSRRVNISIEDRVVFVQDDLMDGQRWSEQTYGDAVMTKSNDRLNLFSIGLNFNLF
ncbi:MAG: hypothetical protein ACO29O_04150 [Chitinophagaceae bacterium]